MEIVIQDGKKYSKLPYGGQGTARSCKKCAFYGGVGENCKTKLDCTGSVFKEHIKLRNTK